MKTSKKQRNTGGKIVTPRPEIRDDLDSRENKEEKYTSRNNKQGVKSNTRSKNKAGN